MDSEILKIYFFYTRFTLHVIKNIYLAIIHHIHFIIKQTLQSLGLLNDKAKKKTGLIAYSLQVFIFNVKSIKFYAGLSRKQDKKHI